MTTVKQNGSSRSFGHDVLAASRTSHIMSLRQCSSEKLKFTGSIASSSGPLAVMVTQTLTKPLNSLLDTTSGDLDTFSYKKILTFALNN